MPLRRRCVRFGDKLEGATSVIAEGVNRHSRFWMPVVLMVS